MIVTDRFVFIHMHKTGGQTLNQVIKRCCPTHRAIGYHFPICELPAEFVSWPVVGIVRNPWDWYVSWYAFNCRPNIRNPLFDVVSDGGTADFGTTVSNLINLGSSQDSSRQHRETLIRILPETLDQNRGVGLTKQNIQDFSDNETGYYSWLFRRMVGDGSSGPLYVGHFENLAADFLHIMEQLEVSERDAITLELKKDERRNSSRHSHYSHYYGATLRNLVATRERELIESYGYEFDMVGTPENVFTFENNQAAGNDQGFEKLLGQSDNYLQLHEGIDIEPIAAKISTVTDKQWAESGRERRFDVHRDTQALLVIHFEDFRYEKPEIRDIYREYEADLAPIVNYISQYYQDNGFIVRLMFAKLISGGKIPEHTDTGYSLLNCHRIHIPIVTNDDAIFFVGGEEKNMRVGEFWEINNGRKHSVDNRGSEDRVHLIIDWMPNQTGQPQAALLVSDQHHTEGAVPGDTASLNLLVAEAFQLHRAGDVKKAKSVYQQVLDFDAHHVDCNNLLGLLCLQTGQFQDAVDLIEHALAIKPDDPRAHANLGLALKSLGRLPNAAYHFRQAIELDPANSNAQNNLGNICRELGQPNDAIECYRRALILMPGYAEAHCNLGSTLLQVGQIPAAVMSLKQSLALKPDFEIARNELQKALQALRKQAGA